MNTHLRAMLMPIWDDCPWQVPGGVEVRRDGNLVAFLAGGKSVGVKLDSFVPERLSEVMSRLGVRAAPASPGPV